MDIYPFALVVKIFVFVACFRGNAVASEHFLFGTFCGFFVISFASIHSLFIHFQFFNVSLSHLFPAGIAGEGVGYANIAAISAPRINRIFLINPAVIMARSDAVYT